MIAGITASSEQSGSSPVPPTVTWTERNTQANALDAVHGDGCALAVIGGSIYVTGEQQKVGAPPAGPAIKLVSADGGITWARTDISAQIPDANYDNAIAYGNAVLVGVFHDHTGAARVFTSADGGAVWTNRGACGFASIAALRFYGDTFLGKKFLAIGAALVGGAPAVATSADGVAWTHLTQPQHNRTSGGGFIAWDDTTWALFGNDGQVVTSFDNAVTFFESVAPTGSGFTAVAGSNGVYIAAVLATVPRVIRSTNGASTWSAEIDVGLDAAQYIYGVARTASGLWVVAAQNSAPGEPNYATSLDDGLTWVAYNSPELEASADGDFFVAYGLETVADRLFTFIAGPTVGGDARGRVVTGDVD